jgi:hypothetical protein
MALTPTLTLALAPTLTLTLTLTQVTITRVEFGELEKAQAQQLGLVERLTAQVEEQALKLDRAKVKVETAERLAAKQVWVGGCVCLCVCVCVGVWVCV